MSERTGSLKKFSRPAWAITEHASYPLLLLIATPWFVHRLGPEQYGNWMLLTAIVAISGVLNAGTGAATVKAVSGALGRDSRADTQRAVNASIAIAVAGGALLAGLVFATFQFGADSLLGRMGDRSLVLETGLAAAALIWIEQVDNAFSSAVKGAEHFGYAAKIEITAKLLQTVAAAIAVFVSPSLIPLYATLFVVAMARLAAKRLATKRLLQLDAIRPTFDGARDILHFAKWGWLQGIGGTLFGVADRILVASLLGANALTHYSIASQLAMQVHAISAAGLSVIFPAISRQREQHGFELRRLTRNAVLSNFIISTCLAALLLLLGPPFLRLWIGGEVAEQATAVLPWLVGAYWLLAGNTVFFYTLLGLGEVRFVSLTVIAAGLCAAGTAYLTISQFGLVGAPMGRAVYALLSLVLAVPVIAQLRRPDDRRSKNHEFAHRDVPW